MGGVAGPTVTQYALAMAPSPSAALTERRAAFLDVRSRNEFTVALELAESWVEAAREAGEAHHRAALVDLLTIASDICDFQRAFAVLDEIRSLSDPRGPVLERLRVVMTLGNAYAALNDIEAGFAYTRAAVRLAAASRQTVAVAAAQANLAFRHLVAGDLDGTSDGREYERGLAVLSAFPQLDRTTPEGKRIHAGEKALRSMFLERLGRFHEASEAMHPLVVSSSPELIHARLLVTPSRIRILDRQGHPDPARDLITSSLAAATTLYGGHPGTLLIWLYEAAAAFEATHAQFETAYGYAQAARDLTFRLVRDRPSATVDVTEWGP